MKRTLTSIILCGLLAFANSAGAYFVGATDVGNEDNLLAWTDLANSGTSTELAWINSQLGSSYTIDTQTPASSLSWSAVNGSSTIFATTLADSPDYYLVKTGGGPGTITDFLFQNLTSKEWAVLDLYAAIGVGGGLGLDSNLTVTRISHISEFGGTPVPPVPEPGTILLLGGGLLGLAVYGRKRMSRS